MNKKKAKIVKSLKFIYLTKNTYKVKMPKHLKLIW